MLPEDPTLLEALDRVELVHLEDARQPDQFVVAPRRERQLPNGELVRDATEVALQTIDSSIRIQSLIERVARALRTGGHSHLSETEPSRLQIASAIVALATLKRGAAESLLETLNAAIRLASQTRVYAWAMLPGTTESRTKHRFGDFVYGKPDLERLRECCQRAGSDYFELEGETFRERLAIQRHFREVNVIDPSGLQPERKLDAESAATIYRIADDYYGAIAEAEQRDFLLDLDRQQAVYGAAGLGAISAETVRRLGGLTTWVVVFNRRERGHGWVIPNRGAHNITVVEPEAYAEGLKKIQTGLRLEDWGTRPLDEIIQRFSEYFAAAEVFRNNGQLEESLLHMVFGLDLILGGEGSEPLGETLGDRVAMLVHRPLGHPIPQITSFVRDCYEMRSGYAHRGERGNLDVPYKGLRLSSRLDDLASISRVVLAAACFARVQQWAQGNDARKRWIGRVDILRAKSKAGVGLAQLDLEHLGVDRVRIAEERPPPAVTLEWRTSQ